jgi:hypothetical protein
MLQAEKSWVRLLMRSLHFSSDLNFHLHCGPRTTLPLTEMGIRNLPGGNGWPVHKADNLTAICEPNV